MDDFGGLSKHSVNGAECVGNGCVKQVHRVVGLDRLCNGWCGVGDCSQQHLSMTTSQKFKDRNPVERVEMYNVNSLDVSCVHGFSFGSSAPFVSLLEWQRWPCLLSCILLVQHLKMPLVSPSRSAAVPL
jgi:hypothetical protein